MKKLVQLVALLVIGLLALAPAVAGLSCALSQRTVYASGCPMARTAMGPHCPMGRQMAMGGCPRSCCPLKLPQAAAVFTATEKPRFTLLAGLSSIPFAAPQAAPAPALKPAGPHPEASPPLYLLNRVFRI